MTLSVSSRHVASVARVAQPPDRYGGSQNFDDKRRAGLWRAKYVYVLQICLLYLQSAMTTY